MPSQESTAVWWLSNRLRSEWEFCRDELAVQARGQRLTYATALEVADRQQRFSAQPVFGTAWGQHHRAMLPRIRHIPGLPPMTCHCRSWVAGTVGVLLLATLLVPPALAWGRPATKTNEIVIAACENDLPGPVIVWRYDPEKRTYVKSYEKEDIAELLPSVAIGDADNDGRNDIAVASRAGRFLLRNTPDGFLCIELDSPGVDESKTRRHICIGDADNDGDNEILALGRPNDGKLQEFAADYPELYKSRRERPSLLSCYEYSKEGRAQMTNWFVRHLSRTVNIKDIDGDGDNEVVVRSWGQITFYTKRGDNLSVVGAVTTDPASAFRSTLDQKIENLVPEGIEKLSPEWWLKRRPALRKRLEKIHHEDVKTFYKSVNGYDGEIWPIIDVSGLPAFCAGYLDGTNSLCIAISGMQSTFQVIRGTGGGFERFYLSDPNLLDREQREYVGACAIGDADNDGKMDILARAKRLILFSQKQSTLEKVWESPELRSWTGEVCIADCDNDGLNEIIYGDHTDTSEQFRKRDGEPGYGSNLILLKNSGRGKRDFKPVWRSPPYPGSAAIAVGDLDGQ